MYEIIQFPEIEEDLVVLPKDIILEVFEYFEKYKLDPYKYSKPLYNQGNIKLKGYRKTYVADAAYRIVIKIEDNIAKIVEVVTVGKREDKEVYLEANERINK